MCLMPNEILENKSFESLKYNISDATQDIRLDYSCDPDSNYFNTKISIFNISIQTLIHHMYSRGIS